MQYPRDPLSHTVGIDRSAKAASDPKFSDNSQLTHADSDAAIP